MAPRHRAEYPDYWTQGEDQLEDLKDHAGLVG